MVRQPSLHALNTAKRIHSQTELGKMKNCQILILITISVLAPVHWLIIFYKWDSPNGLDQRLKFEHHPQVDLQGLVPFWCFIFKDLNVQNFLFPSFSALFLFFTSFLAFLSGFADFFFELLRSFFGLFKAVSCCAFSLSELWLTQKMKINCPMNIWFGQCIMLAVQPSVNMF